MKLTLYEMFENGLFNAQTFRRWTPRPTYEVQKATYSRTVLKVAICVFIVQSRAQ